MSVSWWGRIWGEFFSSGSSTQAPGFNSPVHISGSTRISSSSRNNNYRTKPGGPTKAGRRDL